MPTDLISDMIKRTSNLLKQGAVEQILEHEKRLNPLQTYYNDILSERIVSNFSTQSAYETAKAFFGKSDIQYAAIDGTMYIRSLFDLLIFFGGAYASTGSIRLNKTSPPTIQYETEAIKKATGISSVVPIYISDIPDIDQTFFSEEQPEEIAINKPLQDSAIINNTTIANRMMSFAEYFLAYQLATDQTKNIHLLLLDRSLSNELANLLYDTSKTNQWKVRCSLLGYKVDNTALDSRDFYLGRHHIQNNELAIPPPRGVYLPFALMSLIQKTGSIQKDQIFQNFRILDDKRRKSVERYIKRLKSDKILVEKNNTYIVSEKYLTTWLRLKKLVDIIGNRIFYGYTETPKHNVLKIQKNGKEYWLTTLDIAFLTLFTFQMLMEECWKRKILLIGVTKDTAARDMKRQLIPIIQRKGLIKNTPSLSMYHNLPNTDRMILQSTSITNHEKVKVPWALSEYDSAFRTMVPVNQPGNDYVLGAIKNRISIEKTFVKTYIQLAQGKKDPLLRSNVLLTDRLTYPRYDIRSDTTLNFWNEFGGAKEPLEVIVYRDRTIPNPIQNLTMTILHAMNPSSIPEAFGHNKPLFIADKIAKWHYGQFKRIADTTATWILNNKKLRKFVFYMSTFRERRTIIEATRRTSN